MRLILLDLPSPRRANFHPVALSRPIWTLRSGTTTLGEKLVAAVAPSDVACFVPAHIAPVYAAGVHWKVNDSATLAGDDLLLVNGRVRADGWNVAPTGPGAVSLDGEGEVLYARLRREDVQKAAAAGSAGTVEKLLDWAVHHLPHAEPAPAWNYIWELVLGNSQQLVADFRRAGRCGVEGQLEQPSAIRGSQKDVYVAAGAMIHPMVVLDAANGPIYIDEGAEIQPFSRVEGPCYIGQKSILLGAKCREGNTIGPMCRIGGEVEESIIQGYSNKYHDGFVGHAFLGEWCNLGALTTNSDLKNDYSNVSMVLDGRRSLDTGSTKVGMVMGDHTRTSIGTLFNTGAYIGAMSLILANGRPLTKFIPSFVWLLDGRPTAGKGREKSYQTASIAMGRRKVQWTPQMQAMWDAIYELTADERAAAQAHLDERKS